MELFNNHGILVENLKAHVVKRILFYSPFLTGMALPRPDRHQWIFLTVTSTLSLSGKCDFTRCKYLNAYLEQSRRLIKKKNTVSRRFHIFLHLYFQNKLSGSSMSPAGLDDVELHHFPSEAHAWEESDCFVNQDEVWLFRLHEEEG